MSSITTDDQEKAEEIMQTLYCSEELYQFFFATFMPLSIPARLSITNWQVAKICSISLCGMVMGGRPIKVDSAVQDIELCADSLNRIMRSIYEKEQNTKVESTAAPISLAFLREVNFYVEHFNCWDTLQTFMKSSFFGKTTVSANAFLAFNLASHILHDAKQDEYPASLIQVLEGVVDRLDRVVSRMYMDIKQVPPPPKVVKMEIKGPPAHGFF